MFFSYFTLTIALALFSSVLTASQAEGTTPVTALKQIEVRHDVRFEWRPQTSAAIIRFATGCRSTTMGKPNGKFEVKLDRTQRSFLLKGSFLMQPRARKIRIGTADCMGSRTEVFKITDVAQGAYSVVYNGKALWALELGAEPLTRIRSRMNTSRPQPVKFKPFYNMIRKGKTIRRAPVTKITYPRDVKRRALIGYFWSAQSAGLRIVLSTGCLATSARNLRDTFAFSLDRTAKTLSINGDYWYTQRSRIATRDCMKTTSQAYDFSGLAQGRYRIIRNGKTLQMLDLGTSDWHTGTFHKSKPRLLSAWHKPAGATSGASLSLQLNSGAGLQETVIRGKPSMVSSHFLLGKPSRQRR